MVDLTVVILTKNEEKNIRKCIASFRGIAKRFVIVDSHSTDGTERVCAELNVELQRIGSCLDFYENTWINYATQLNWGLTQTNITTQWSMRMDADEELMEALAQEINTQLPAVADNVNGVVLRRRVYFMGRWIKHGEDIRLLLRIFRTGKALCEQKVMDEHMILSDGATVNFKHDLIDNNQKDLEWWISKHNWYSNREVLDHQMTVEQTVEGAALLENGISTQQAKMKRIVKNRGYYGLPKFFRAHLYFFYRYYVKLGFLNGPEGRIFHFLQAYWYRFLVDAKMYECEKYDRRMKMQGDLQHRQPLFKVKEIRKRDVEA